MGLLLIKPLSRMIRTAIFAVVLLIAVLISSSIIAVKPLYASGPPAAPQNLTAIAISSTRIYLRWLDRSDNEIKFIIERKTGKGGYFPVNEVGSNVNAYVDSGLNPGAVYSYRVKAHGSAGDSAYSNEVTIMALPSPVKSPVLLTPANGVIVTTLTPLLKWVPSEGNVTYSIQIAYDSDFSRLLINRTDVMEPYYQVPPYVFKWNSAYYWRVKTQNENSVYSGWSDSWYFKVFPQSFGLNHCNCR
jgi:hypothetical protein